MEPNFTALRRCVLDVQCRRLLVPLLPLVVHTLHSVRRAVSRVLALTLFGNAAQQWTGFASAAAATAAHAAEAAGLDASAWQPQQQNGQQQQQQQAVLLPGGVNGVLLPELFLRQYKFPFRVLPVSVAAAAAAVPGSAQGMHHQGLQEQQQQGWVKQLVEQQQLLQLAGNSAAAARALLADCLPRAAHHISQRVLSATANQLFNVDAAAVAQRLLAAVQASGSHAECEQALQQLEQLASTYQGLQAIATAGSSPSSDVQAAAVTDAGDVKGCRQQQRQLQLAVCV
jgi:rotatin